MEGRMIEKEGEKKKKKSRKFTNFFYGRKFTVVYILYTKRYPITSKLEYLSHVTNWSEC